MTSVSRLAALIILDLAQVLDYKYMEWMDNQFIKAHILLNN